MVRALILISPVTLVSGCHITQRKHLKGWYVSWNFKKHQKQKGTEQYIDRENDSFSHEGANSQGANSREQPFRQMENETSEYTEDATERLDDFSSVRTYESQIEKQSILPGNLNVLRIEPSVYRSIDRSVLYNRKNMLALMVGTVLLLTGLVLVIILPPGPRIIGFILAFIGLFIGLFGLTEEPSENAPNEADEDMKASGEARNGNLHLAILPGIALTLLSLVLIISLAILTLLFEIPIIGFAIIGVGLTGLVLIIIGILSMREERTFLEQNG